MGVKLKPIPPQASLWSDLGPRLWGPRGGALGAAVPGEPRVRHTGTERKGGGASMREGVGVGNSKQETGHFAVGTRH